MRSSRVRFHEHFEQKWEKFEQHENYTLSSARAYSLRRRVPNAIRPHSQNCYNDSRPITLEIFEPYRYVPPQSVGFLRRFGMKTGTDFAHFGLESDVVYEGTTIVDQCVRRFNSK